MGQTVGQSGRPLRPWYTESWRATLVTRMTQIGAEQRRDAIPNLAPCDGGEALRPDEFPQHEVDARNREADDVGVRAVDAVNEA